jgi:outer membrane protein TolC
MAAAAESEYRKAELDLALEAREAFLAGRRAEALGEVTRRGLELARENVRLTRLLKERGLQAEVDVLEAERAEAEAEAGLLQAENGAALARANLNRVMGRPVDSPLELEPEGELPGEPEDLQALTARAVDARPEVLTLRHNIAAAEAGVRLARAAGRPRVDLEAAYALQTETALVPKSGVAAGVTITAPIWNGAVNRYTVREAQERLEQLRAAVTALEQGIALEVQRQRLAMQEARARMAVADRAVAAAEKAFEITRLRLERGRAVQVEVLNSRLSLQRALADRAAAENDLRVAQARLDRAVGAGTP